MCVQLCYWHVYHIVCELGITRVGVRVCWVAATPLHCYFAAACFVLVHGGLQRVVVALAVIIRVLANTTLSKIRKLHGVLAAWTINCSTF
jgi:hypothetical protein